MDQNQEIIPVDVEPMDARQAEKTRVLVKEDIAKYEFEISQHRAAIYQLEAAVCKARLILADIDRRVVGADYPAPPEHEPQMGAPVGGK